MRLAGKALGLATVGLLAIALSGCDGLLSALGVRTEETIAETTDGTSGDRIGTQALSTGEDGNMLRNEDAGIQLTLPSSWSEDLSLHESAELQASDPDRQLYVIVVAEDDESLLRLGLQENAENYRTLLVNRLASSSGQTKTDTAFIGDNFANQYEIRGQVDDSTPVVYLHTTVVTEQRYYQIVAWTTPEQYPAYASELREITQSFEEIGS